MSADNANSLIYHPAHQNYTRLMGFGWGNEQTGASKAQQYLQDMTAVRAALEKAFHPGGATKRPLLVGTDSGVGSVAVVLLVLRKPSCRKYLLVSVRFERGGEG